jgi:uncharacterized protein (TIGR02611 family)
LSEAKLTPRIHALLSRLDAWAAKGTARALLIKIGVTVTGPVVILAGVAMLVLPGPGLLAIAVGLALLALEYRWARHVLARMGRTLSLLREAVLPKECSPRRRALGASLVAAIAVAGFAVTAAVTAVLGAYTAL